MEKQRIPCTPLSYALKNKVGPKELLIDYTGDGTYNRLYITDDNLNIIDITEQIITKIENAKASNSTIEVDGYGTANLQDFINLLNGKINTSVQMADIGSNIKFIQKDNRIDNKSLEVKNKYIQLKGFDSAMDGTIPVKAGNNIIWTDTNIKSTTDGSSENPDDGISYNTIEQNIISSKVYLQASIRQKTTNPAKDFGVVLPDTQDQFCQIQWLLITNSFVPAITFSDNCLWKSVASASVKANVYHLFKFTTYNGGSIWLAESNIYQYTSSEITSASNYYIATISK